MSLGIFFPFGRKFTTPPGTKWGSLPPQPLV